MIRELLPSLITSQRPAIEAAFTSPAHLVALGERSSTVHLGQRSVIDQTYRARFLMDLFNAHHPWKRVSKQRLPNLHWVRTLTTRAGHQAMIESDPTDSTILGAHLSLTDTNYLSVGAVFWTQSFDARAIQVALITSTQKETRLKGITLAAEHHALAPSLEDKTNLTEPVITTNFVTKAVSEALYTLLVKASPNRVVARHSAYSPKPVLKATKNKSGRLWTGVCAGGDFSVQVQSDVTNQHLVFIKFAVKPQSINRYQCPDRVTWEGASLREILAKSEVMTQAVTR